MRSNPYNESIAPENGSSTNSSESANRVSAAGDIVEPTEIPNSLGNHVV
jgi:hypothetical protein